MHGTNGPSGTSGGTVSGVGTDTLSIAGYEAGDVGGYTLTVTNSCGSGTSAAATLGLGCPADFNNSCALEAQDIFDFLSAWFAGCPPFPQTCPADFNGRGGLTVQDIFDFIAAWFAGC